MGEGPPSEPLDDADRGRFDVGATLWPGGGEPTHRTAHSREVATRPVAVCGQARPGALPAAAPADRARSRRRASGSTRRRERGAVPCVDLSDEVLDGKGGATVLCAAARRDCVALVPVLLAAVVVDNAKGVDGVDSHAAVGVGVGRVSCMRARVRVYARTSISCCGGPRCGCWSGTRTGGGRPRVWTRRPGVVAGRAGCEGGGRGGSGAVSAARQQQQRRRQC